MVQEIETTPLERNEYWAELEDEEKLIPECQARVKAYADTLKSTSLYPRILRNWRYYHNLYYGSAADRFSGMELKLLGEQGEKVGASFNHFRNFVRHIISIILQDKIEFDTRARNTEQDSLDQALLGNAVLDDYVDRDRILRWTERALEHALVLTEGFTLVEWDFQRGEPFAVDRDDDGNPASLIYSGENKLSNPTVFDVARDLRVRTWEDNQWFIVRTFENKFDLVALYPDLEEEILSQAEEEEDFWEFHRAGISHKETDLVSVFKLFHMRTPRMPEGKLFEFTGDVALTPTTQPLPYRNNPLRRVTDGEIVLTQLGYSQTVDLQGPQEAFNGETSSICSNHKNYGEQLVWSPQAGGSISHEKIGPFHVMKSKMKPEGINLTFTAPEIFAFRDSIKNDMEEITAVNTRNPAPNIRSGTQMALLDAQAQIFQSPIAKSYREHIENVGSDILWNLNQFSPEGHERIVASTGKHARSVQKTFQKGSLDLVDRVTVKLGNPLSRTTSGRLELANLYVNAGQVRMPEHIVELVETGQIGTLVEAERAQLRQVREENERLMDPNSQDEIVPLATEYHVLHIREHQVPLTSVDLKNDPARRDRLLAHLMLHVTALMDPQIQLLQMILGFPTAVPPLQGPVQGQQGPQTGSFTDNLSVEGGDTGNVATQNPQLPKTPQAVNF